MKKENITEHPLYWLWNGIKQRCYDSNSTNYKNYGGRGIKMCDEWLTFDGFRKWADEHPRLEGTSLDRIDVNGDYEPSNCKWATRKEQGRNTRVNHYYTFHGETKLLCEWAEISGINESVLLRRIKLGWNEDDMFKPVAKRNMLSNEDVDGICQEILIGHTYKDIAKHFNTDSTIVLKIANGQIHADIAEKYGFFIEPERQRDLKPRGARMKFSNFLKEAEENPNIKKPISWALYKTWRWANAHEKSRQLT